MSDAATLFHETWLGMVQPSEGLVLSIPVLVDAQCMERHAPATQKRFLEHLRDVEGDSEAVELKDLAAFLADEALLHLTPDLFDQGEALPEDLNLYVREGGQTLRPTMALRQQAPAPATNGDGVADDSTPASRAGAAYVLLLWDLPAGLALDKAETQTGSWDYPPAAKFDRLLRHCRVRIGLLSSRRELRLIYAPHGESSGSITFRLADMAQVGGRPILDAFLMLLSARRFFGVDPKYQLPCLLKDSRERQANVTNELADQVLEGLTILLHGFEAAAERDGWRLLKDALERQHDHLYGGLLTVMLRLVFLLYAEDRGLMPIENQVYAKHLSVLNLFQRLQEDHGAFPDSMSRRFGAWNQLVALFRAVFLGVEHGTLSMPPRHGQLFDPYPHAFLEGWGPEGAPPVNDPVAVAAVNVPTVDDETVFRVLEKLLLFQSQRLSYRALDVEQIGSVYEGLMGHHVERLSAPGVCLRPSRVWVTADAILGQPESGRVKWLKDEIGLQNAQATKLAGELKGLAGEAEVLDVLDRHRVANTERAKAGSLVIQPGAERRRTSSHYTPRSLTEPIVRRTLEPLLKAMGPDPSSGRLLDLKVCDPAMGSGAFLVEACRFLADQVVAAWTREGKERVASTAEDVVNHARRLVAERCLYGVDKNPYAVNLAKLSLWLVTLAKNRPFTFLDHALRHGDSLVGLSFAQIRAFHWKPEKQLELFTNTLNEALDDAIELRQQILDLAHQPTLWAAQEKEWLLRHAEDAVERVRVVGDLIAGAFFAGKNETARRSERERRLILVRDWLQQGGPPTPEIEVLRAEIRSVTPVFHWMLEFPEIFYIERPDPLDSGRSNRKAWIDGFVGNPPFVTGRDRAKPYNQWLTASFPGTAATADIAAFFFRQAFELIGAHGAMGLIATASVATGDSRESGLQWIAVNGGAIYAATSPFEWPGAAGVHVVIAHVGKGNINPPDRVLDGHRVAALDSQLKARSERRDPSKLATNKGMAFQGCILYPNDLFELTAEERADLVLQAPHSAQYVRRFVRGEDITEETGSLTRYVIYFGDAEECTVSEHPRLRDLLLERLPSTRGQAGDSETGQWLRTNWWRFWRPRADSVARLRETGERCICAPRVAAHLMLKLMPTCDVFSEDVVVFFSADPALLAVLQSRVHAVWAWLRSGKRRGDLRYGIEDCIETFPFPRPLPGSSIPELAAAGQRLIAERDACLAERRGVTLTSLYHDLVDPHCDDVALLKLRGVHEDLDRTVLSVYATQEGWPLIEVPPYAQGSTDQRALDRFEEEVFERLLALNAERAEEDRIKGHTSRGRTRVNKQKPKRGADTADGPMRRARKARTPAHDDMPLLTLAEAERRCPQCGAPGEPFDPEAMPGPPDVHCEQCRPR